MLARYDAFSFHALEPTRYGDGFHACQISNFLVGQPIRPCAYQTTENNAFVRSDENGGGLSRPLTRNRIIASIKMGMHAHAFLLAPLRAIIC